MRIAMLGNFPVDPKKMPGGVEAVIHNLVVSLAKNTDLDVHVLSCNHTIEKSYDVQYKGITVHHIKGQKRFGSVSANFLDRKNLKAATMRLQPDIVHSHGTGYYVAAAQSMNFPHVITVHGIRYREVVLFKGLREWIGGVVTTRLEKSVLGKAGHIFVIADYVKNAIKSFTKANFYPIANPVSSRFFDMETTDEDNLILSVAAIQPRKGVIHLVEALGLVKKEIPNAKLRLIGKVLVPDYKEKILQKISELGLEDSVEMLGFVTDEELQDSFTSCSVFCLCSVEESSPVSIAEAMTLGKPVIATSVGGVPDLIADGKSGYLTTFGDVPGIAEALINILSDPERRKRFGVEARARADRDFHPDAIAQYSTDIYKQILEKNGA